MDITKCEIAIMVQALLGISTLTFSAPYAYLSEQFAKNAIVEANKEGGTIFRLRELQEQSFLAYQRSCNQKSPLTEQLALQAKMDLKRFENGSEMKMYNDKISRLYNWQFWGQNGLAAGLMLTFTCPFAAILVYDDKKKFEYQRCSIPTLNCVGKPNDSKTVYSSLDAVLK